MSLTPEERADAERTAAAKQQQDVSADINNEAYKEVFSPPNVEGMVRAGTLNAVNLPITQAAAVTGPDGVGNGTARDPWNSYPVLDLMSPRPDKATTVLGAIGEGLFKTPVEFAKGLALFPIRAGAQLAMSGLDLVTGNKVKSVNIPLLGNVETIQEIYARNRAMGVSPFQSAVDAAGAGIQDILVGAAVYEGAKYGVTGKGFSPRGKYISETAPEASGANYYWGMNPEAEAQAGLASGEGRIRVAYDKKNAQIIQDIVRRDSSGTETQVPGTEKRFAAPSSIWNTFRKVGTKLDEAGMPTPKNLRAFDEAVTALPPEKQVPLLEAMFGELSVRDLNENQLAKYTNVLNLVRPKELGGLAVDVPKVGMWSKLLEPMRHVFEDIENSSGGRNPVYSQVYRRALASFKMSNVIERQGNADISGIFGKFQHAKYSEARRVLYKKILGEPLTAEDAAKYNPELDASIPKVRQFFDNYWKVFDVGSYAEYIKDYLPMIRKAGSVEKMLGGPTAIPEGFNFFAEMERTGALDNLETDPLILMRKYVSAGARKTAWNPFLENYDSIKGAFDPQVREMTDAFVKQHLFQGDVKSQLQTIQSSFESVARAVGATIPPDMARRLHGALMSTIYSNGLGFRPWAAMRNWFQYALMAYPELGPSALVDGWKGMYGKELLRNEADGWIDNLIPRLEDVNAKREAEGKSSIPAAAWRVLDAQQKFAEAGLNFYGKSDILTRSATVTATREAFKPTFDAFKAGKIGWDEFAKGIDLGAENPAVQREMRRQVQSGNFDEGLNLKIQTVLDRTQFPSRPGEGAYSSYGLYGKYGWTFSHFTAEFANTIFRDWIRRGQWQKIMRFVAIGGAVNGAFKEAGADAQGFTGFAAIKGSPSPAFGLIANIMGYAGAKQAGLSSEIDKQWKDVLSQLTMFKPWGNAVQISNLQKLAKELSMTKEMKDPKTGKITYWTPMLGVDFGEKNPKVILDSSPSKEILRLMFGVPLSEQSQTFDVVRSEKNFKYETDVSLQDAYKAFVDKDEQKLKDILSSYQDRWGVPLKITSSGIKAYYLSLKTPVPLQAFLKGNNLLKYLYGKKLLGQ